MIMAVRAGLMEMTAEKSSVGVWVWQRNVALCSSLGSEIV